MKDWWKQNNKRLVGLAVLAGIATLVLLKRQRYEKENGTKRAPGQGLSHFFAPVYDLLFGASYA